MKDLREAIGKMVKNVAAIKELGVQIKKEKENETKTK